MAVRRLHHEQPAHFAFTPENLAWAEREVRKYPEGRQASAVIALLWRAQEQERWVSEPAIRWVADFLGMPYIRVLEVATFYTMFLLEPPGRKAHIQVCGTTPCMLRGSDDLFAVCRRRIASTPHTVSADGNFSWEEVECLGACVNAPLVQIGADTFEDLTAERFEALLDDIAAGRPVHPGPQVERDFSAPAGDPTSLTDPELYPGDGDEGPGSAPRRRGRLTDADAKKSTEAANVREAAIPKPPVADSSDRRRT